MTGQEAMGTNETQEVPSELRKHFFYCEDDQALAQVVQKGGVSIVGDIQKPSQHDPGQQVLGAPA